MAADLKSLRERLPYRNCAGVALFNSQGKVFIGRRKNGSDSEKAPESGAPWQMPQGGIDADEGPIEAARRELFEETGVSSIELIAEAPDWVLYDLPDDLLGTALKGKYRGQRQRWFAFRFTGAESEIDVLTPGGGKFRAEFDSWRWEELKRTPDLIVPFKRDAYEQIAAAFADLPARLVHG
jgi:putative (di)nucleoside polyphosphate hydrolase